MMKSKVFELTKIGAKFGVVHRLHELNYFLGKKDYLFIIWNTDQNDLKIEVDGRALLIQPNELIFLTYNHHLFIPQKNAEFIALVFNRAFYCIHTNDSEVSCNGLLFFGSDSSPILSLPESEKEKLETLVHVLRNEFEFKDINQEEMLRILLKRFIIICTRLARNQLNESEGSQSEMDLIRHFNALVEEHFKQKRKVSEYAELLHKSPKTLSNIFHRHERFTPLQVIHNRLVLEAKRLLMYTSKSIKEIGLELGFETPTQFSKFFKKQVEQTPLSFRKSI
jgi:AraC-like DNA-binding protein